MTTFVTWLFDPNKTNAWTIGQFYGYKPFWVDRLYRGIKRNFKEDFELVCMVDDDYPFEEPIRAVKFVDPVQGQGMLPMLEAWRPDITTNRRVSFGLDTIITGDITDIATHPVLFAGIHPREKSQLQNYVTSCSYEGAGVIWNGWKRLENEIRDNFEKVVLPKRKQNANHLRRRGVLLNEENVINYVLGDTQGMLGLNHLFPGRMLKYGRDVHKNPQYLPEGVSIVYFHGNPKPSRIKHPKAQQLLQHWV
jgi:hypothetical protein